ncbi:hypothetical protein C3L33_15621, partial [Rhododendron williamsianum]
MCFLSPPIVVKQFAILPFKGITDGDHASVQHLIQNGSRLRFRFRAISCKMGYFFSPWVNGIYLIQSLMCFFPPPIVVKQFAILPFKGITDGDHASVQHLMHNGSRLRFRFRNRLMDYELDKKVLRKQLGLLRSHLPLMSYEHHLFDSAFALIGKQEGVKGYWKGNLPQVLCIFGFEFVIRITPYSAVQLFAYDTNKLIEISPQNFMRIRSEMDLDTIWNLRGEKCHQEMRVNVGFRGLTFG